MKFSKNKQKVLVWVDADDCDPPHGLDFDSKHDYAKVAMLVDAFSKNGFDLNAPALVGYPLNGRIQLLSGTHRHCAAKETKTKLPVTLWLRSYIEALWGTEHWLIVLEDIPVKELMEYEKEETLRHIVENSDPFIYDDLVYN